jgi:sulfoxide reductase heme-binding subunit YedZ
MKFSARLTVVLLAAAVMGILWATDQILPASSEYQAQIRIWLAARATGIVTLVLLTGVVVMGVLLSHPRQPQWKTAKGIFPWHESMWVFVLAFLAMHVVSLVVDPFAGVGIGGALVPGLSEYRSVPVALGVIGMYAFVVTVVTARYTKLLPRGLWLQLHRLSAVVLVLAWVHGVLAGTDTEALRPLYWTIAGAVVGAVAYRYWVVRLIARRRRPAVVPRAAETAPVPVTND